MPFASDSFTGSTQFQNLPAYSAAWSKQDFANYPDDAFIGSGLTYACAVGDALYVHSGAPAGADYSVFADINDSNLTFTASAASLCGVIGRAQTGSNFYAWLFAGSSNTLVLQSVVSNSSTTLGSPYSFTPTSGVTFNLELRMTGSTIEGYLNGSLAVSATNTDFTTAGKAGVRLRACRESGVADWLTLDNFSGVDAGVAGQPTIRRFGQIARGFGRRRPGVFISRSPLPQAA